MDDIYYYLGGFVWGFFTCWLSGKVSNKLHDKWKRGNQL